MISGTSKFSTESGLLISATFHCVVHISKYGDLENLEYAPLGWRVAMTFITESVKAVPSGIDWSSFERCPRYTLQGPWAFGDAERISACDCEFHAELRSRGIPVDSLPSSKNLWATIKDCPSLTVKDGRVVDESAIGPSSGCNCEFHRMIRNQDISADLDN